MNKFQLFNASEFLMNTRFEMVIWGVDSKISETAFKESVACIKKLELTLSFYDQNSETFLLNRAAYPNEIKVSIQLWEYLILANNYAEKTNSFFNVALGSVYSKLKRREKIEFREHGEFCELVKLDLEKKTVRFLRPDTLIDFGGLGKGIGLKETEQVLQKYAIDNVFVSFGDSSILTKGKHPHGEYWPFTLKDAKNDFILKLNNHAVSISSYKQIEGDENSSHIFNPKNINSPVGNRTVIVQSSNPIDAEVLSTALVASPTENHNAIMENFQSTNIYFH